MRSIPSVNLIEVKYLLPMVDGAIDGVYKIESIRFVTYKDDNGNIQPSMRFKLDEYINFRQQWTKMYRTQIQPSEIISMQTSRKLYE